MNSEKRGFSFIASACSPSSREARAEIQDRCLEVRAVAEAEEEGGLLARSP